ncbi:O-antigen/teichoic acid export membrane protein [Panacagrimonas perspica]|uniref:O-antigen/teichoic acid export membrane protein n=1 Tax=Panacagrimonas perspica TaxID=381431 RepID=A0A4S3K8H7_9GAMM|nr:oligosaccharide flippase family protein [Panacagrimonas perspica]TDU24132.1 O-antigen/teichoic acid export membrane protein [Panacagrimonas perspica]THD04550.1 hypothetical protein B1810_03770 [Panacagrimonas perspica]
MEVAPKKFELVLQSRLNFAAFAISLAVNFVSLPIAITAIGLENFGSAGLALAILAPLSLVGVVIGQAIVRDLSSPAEQGDHEACARIFTAATAGVLIGCLAVGVLTATFGPLLMHKLAADPGQSRSFGGVLELGFAAWLFQQGCFVLQATLAALRSWAKLAAANVIGAVASACCVVAASRHFGNDAGFLGGTATGFAVQFVVLWAFVRSKAPWLMRARRWLPAERDSLFHFARWQGIAGFSSGLANQADRYVIGAVAPLGIVGQYNVAMRLQEVVHAGVLKIAEVLFPHFSITSAHEPASRAAFYVRASWAVNLVSVAALAPLIPWAGSLITLWVDDDAAQVGAPILRTLASAGMIGSAATVFSFLAMATDQAQRLAYINLYHSLILITLTIPLIVWFGPLAAGVAYVVGNTFRLAAAVHSALDHFEGHLERGSILMATLVPLIAALTLAWAVQSFAPSAHGWVSLVLLYCATAILVLAASLALAASSFEGRSLIREVFSKRHQVDRGSS